MDTERRIIYLNPRDLLPSKQNVRSDPGDLAGLAETIREHGILQPLGVTRESEGYRIVYGNRRRDAAIVVGLDRVPCMLIEATADQEVVLQQVLENLQRLDLNDMDKSRAFERLLVDLTDRGLPQGEALDAMARTLGLSARQIQRYLRLRQLSVEVQRLIALGDLGVTHAQHLADITPMERQEAVAALVVDENLSAAELARLCAALEHNTNIEPQLALEMLRRGERIAVVEVKARESLPSFTAPPNPEEKAVEGGDEDVDLVEVESEREGFAGPRGASGSGAGGEHDYGEFSQSEPATRDGNRVRKIHSLDSFMDELQRLTSCVHEGDLQKLAESDEAPAVKLKLATRQLRFLADAVATLAKMYGPLDE
jgi:ParB family transcriptional regulator, chromosome partitioning protein